MRGSRAAVPPVAALLALVPVGPAAAAGVPSTTALPAGTTTSTPSTAAPEAYAYWGSFLLQDGTWTFAPIGPSARTVEDGTVEGWRFATVGVGARPRPPRGAPSFEAVCGGTPPADDQVRVGVVVDYGRPADAPDGDTAAPPSARAACAQVAEGSSGEAVLDAVADIRADDGVLCGLDGYPATTCQPAVGLSDAARTGDEPVDVAVGAPAQEAEQPATAEQPVSGLSGPAGLAVAVVVALGVSAGIVLGARALLRRGRGTS